MREQAESRLSCAEMRANAAAAEVKPPTKQQVTHGNDINRTTADTEKKEQPKNPATARTNKNT